MTELEGRTALVTGAASGIGAAIAARFRAAGAAVAGVDLVAGAKGDHAFVADVRSSGAVDEVYHEIAERIGAPDIVVHAAAATHHGGVFDTAPDVYADLYDVNVIGAVRLLQAATPAMRVRGGGCFILISSINARFATPSLAAYAATKAALENLVQTAALELAPDKIRISAIAPASIDTPALRASYGRQGDAAVARAANIARHPLARLGTSEEVAELALFLASDRSSWITGSVHAIDGGASVTRR